ncbi:MAG: phosphatase PAP2 family protein [Alphaproteobacteria bacterium]|nr:phosphatase PAP2 family protein [Alphaproteobacteria bacterium]
MTQQRYLKAWMLGFITCILLVFVCFRWFDLPVAQLFRGNPARVQGYGLPSAVLLAGELCVITLLAFVRILRGQLPEYAKVMLIALLTSITAFTANDYVLKLIFGVPSPSEVLFDSARHGVHFLAGGPASSFPSGHMALAGGFAGPWIRLQPATTGALAVLLGIGMAMLVMGDWHFLSDVVAGTFVGVTAGLLAGSLWLAHNSARKG